MKPWIVTSMIISLVSSIGAAEACDSCRYDDDAIERAYIKADAVFVAKVIKAEKVNLPSKGKFPGKSALIERVHFRVYKVYKGPFKPGDSYTSETILSGEFMQCDPKSAVNDPVWLEEIDKDGTSRPGRLSGWWLIYKDVAPEVNGLNGCRTQIYEQAGRDFEVLNKLAKSSGKK